MEIMRAFVRPFADTADRPQLYVCLRGPQPARSVFRFRGCGCPSSRQFVADRGGLIRYMGERPADHSGGRTKTRPITLTDGQRYMPRDEWWGSRPSLVSRCFPGKPIVGITVGFHEDRLHSKPGWIAGFALPLKHAHEVVSEHCPGWEIATKPRPTSEVAWEPRLRGRGFKDSDALPYHQIQHTNGQLKR